MPSHGKITPQDKLDFTMRTANVKQYTQTSAIGQIGGIQPLTIGGIIESAKRYIRQKEIVRPGTHILLLTGSSLQVVITASCFSAPFSARLSAIESQIHPKS
jgi:hypothetical protein